MSSDPAPAALLSPSGGGKPAAFSAELLQLTESLAGQPLTLARLLQATQGRGIHLLLLLIALPFIGPIPLPGFSIPFGLVVTLLGARQALNKKPWLPRRLLEKELPQEGMARLLRATVRITRGIEFFLRPRLGFVENHNVFKMVAGVLISLSGLMLMLPLPLPFSNSLPAWTVLLLASGTLGRDGLFFFAGCTMFALSVAFFTTVALGGADLFARITSYFSF